MITEAQLAQAMLDRLNKVKRYVDDCLKIEVELTEKAKVFSDKRIAANLARERRKHAEYELNLVARALIAYTD